MKPDLSRELKTSWWSLAIASLIGLAVVWALSDGGASSSARAEAAAKYESRIGPVSLSAQLRRSQSDIANLEQQIGELKGLVGMRPIAPFLIPGQDEGPYINFVIRVLSQELELEARQAFDLDDKLGFTMLGAKPPNREAAGKWLEMLQLVAKGLFLCTRTPEPLHAVKVTSLTIDPVETGPANRPPLLYEYPFTIEVTGSLESISWLLLQFSSDGRTPGNRDQELMEWLGEVTRKVETGGHSVRLPEGEAAPSPLIVRGFEITSGSEEQSDQLDLLTVRFQLAGMKFLSRSERGEDAALAEVQRREDVDRSKYANALGAVP